MSGSTVKGSQPRNPCKYSYDGTPKNGGAMGGAKSIKNAGKSTKRIVKSTSADGIGPDTAAL